MKKSRRELGLLSDRELGCIGPNAVALVPLGSIEPHGHLPLATDTIIPEQILRRVLDRTEDTWLFPAIPVGYLFKYGAWPGAIGPGHDVMVRLVADIAVGLARIGIRRLFVMSGHDENREPAVLGLHEASRRFGARGIYCDWLDLGVVKAQELTHSKREGHGSELQTSVLLHLFPDLPIELPPAAQDAETEISAGADDIFTPVESGLWIRPVSRDGRASYTGAPANARVETGRLLVEYIVRRAAEQCAALQREPLAVPAEPEAASVA